MNFTLAALIIKRGDTVVWTNLDAAPHTASSVNHVFDSPVLNQNDTYSFTFTATGAFPYYCIIHPSMQATVTVTE